jgi:hypothetical protein
VEAVTQWGLLGTWALDCSLPASHTWSVYLVRAGKVLDVQDYPRASGPRGQVEREIIGAKVSAKGALTYRLKYPDGDYRDLTYAMEPDGKRRIMFNREKGGKVNVRDGKWVDDGKPAPTDSHCK